MVMNREVLTAALHGLEIQRQIVEQQIAQIRSVLPSGNLSTAKKRAQRKRAFSAEARKRIAAAQKRRWAAVRAAAKKS
jgi:hypothetical protein